MNFVFTVATLETICLRADNIFIQNLSKMLFQVL